MEKIKEWREQLALVFKNKTIDALFPPFIFFLTNRFFSLELAGSLTLLYIILLVAYRLIKGHTKKYAVIGVGGVLLSIGLSWLSGDEINYYLPGLITTAVIVVACVVSLALGRPLAALVSHLTRGWPFEWYMRDDIRPAYKNVTLLWAVYFLIRLGLQVPLFLLGEFSIYFYVNAILGWPMNIVLLIATYVLGMRSLKKLSGPSVEEFLTKQKPPYKGQQKGF